MARTRFSPQRSLILEYVKQSTDHPTAEEIYQALKDCFPGLSRGTVYRNLNFFKEQGMVISVGVIGGQERFDANVTPHAHFICSDCGRVIDVDIPTAQIEALYDHVAHDASGHVIGHQLTFTGRCGFCKGSLLNS